MHRPLVTWSAVVGGLVVYDVWCARNDVEGDSLSEVVRDVYRVHTPAGRMLLIGSWAALTGWLLPHLLRRAVTAVETVAQDRTRGGAG